MDPLAGIKNILGKLRRPRSRPEIKAKSLFNRLIANLILTLIVCALLGVIAGAYNLWQTKEVLDNPDHRSPVTTEKVLSGLDNLMCLDPESKLCKDHLRHMKKIRKELNR